MVDPSAPDGWESFVGWDNLLASCKSAAAGKRGRADVARWEYRVGDHLLRLQRALIDDRWRPGPYRRFEVHEPKRRLISAAPFADRIVHHALMRVTAPRFDRSFSPRSFANRTGLGTLAAIDTASKLCAQHAWALRLDVKQHFPSIDHAILLDALHRRIPEPRLMAVVERIVAGAAGDDAPALYLPGDDLFAATQAARDADRQPDFAGMEQLLPRPD